MLWWVVLEFLGLGMMWAKSRVWNKGGRKSEKDGLALLRAEGMLIGDWSNMFRFKLRSYAKISSSSLSSSKKSGM